jgi:acyl carrier protein
MTPVKATISRILEEKLALDKDELKDDARFYQDLGVDSLDFLEAIVEVEKAFKIDIPDDEYERLGTVGALIAYVTDKVGKKRVAQVA